MAIELDKSEKESVNHPYTQAWAISKYCTFWWLNPLFKIAKKRQLQQTDMFPVLQAESGEQQNELFQRNWPKERLVLCGKKLNSLFICLCKCYGLPFMGIGILAFITMALTVARPLFVGLLVGYFAPGSQVTTTEAYLYATGLSLASILMVFTRQWYFFMTYRFGIRTNVMLSAAIFRKALRLKSRALSRTSIGFIVNLLANDALKMKLAYQFLHMLWISPLLAIIITILLWQQVGFASLAGLGVLLSMIVQQSSLVAVLVKFRQKYLKFADERVRMMNEIISSMRTIKMYAWEKSFAGIIKQLRRKEMNRLFNGYKFYALNQASYLIINSITSFVTVIVYVLMGNTIDSSKVFTVYSLLNSLQVTMSVGVPEAIRAVTDAKVSFARIEKHLRLDECEENLGYFQSLDISNKDQLVLNDVSASWDNGFSLKNISCTVPRGKLLSVIGAVGSGKTSLLMCILGELPLSAGTLRVNGKIAYVPQIPWIFSGSVKENILFGSEYDDEKYLKVIEACALAKDIQQLPHNDLTYVGERGFRLSGGQKARIGLARAIYSDADIYIMDDPLSAVDITVAHHLYDKCINGLLKDRTRILVTHQIQMLDKADEIITIEDGRIVHSGSSKELIEKGIDLTAFVKSDDDTKASVDDEKIEGLHKSDAKDLALQDEARNEGEISFKTYLKFASAGNGLSFLIFVISISIIGQGAGVVTDWWLSRWSDAFVIPRTNRSTNNSTILEEESLFGLTNRIVIIIYSCLLIGAWILNISRCLSTIKLVTDSAKDFHDRMLQSILRAPIYFFDTNPVGRVLNRFSKDLNQIDNEVPFTALQVIQVGIYCCSLVVTTMIFNPWTVIPAIFIVLSFVIVRKFYLRLSRELVRLEATASSPIYSHISTSLQGLTTIRAYKIEDRFMRQFITYQNNHTKPAFALAGLMRWIAFHLDLLSSIYVVFVAFLGVFVRDGLSAGAIGLSLSYLLPLMGNCQWVIRQSAELENQMTSVERISEYSEIQREWLNATSSLPEDWPSNGSLSLENVSFRHQENLPYVLNNISCSISGGEKIGVVGRTGAGKSSLVACFFRMANVDGDVKIDGISTAGIDIALFRSKLSVIPQDPSLFIGTIRNNLDPFNQYDDSQLWNVLEEVQLASYVSMLPHRLDDDVSEGGSNFSVGQKQLICLARAILKKNKILIIDEATANVDLNTDEIIQKSIRNKFHQCTVITIAHRLSTIIDCDRVMVLNGGNLMEFDSPYVLLQNDNSEFANMVKHAGQAEYERLAGIAKEVYHRNKSSQLERSPAIIETNSARDSVVIAPSRPRKYLSSVALSLESSV